MKTYNFDCVVVGGGSAGMAASLELVKNGFSSAVIEREEFLGGILLQCIHNGFGLHEFNEELTGCEYAERFTNQVTNSNIQVFLETTVSEIINDSIKKIHCYSKKHGVFVINAKSIVLAMGCRERNRGNIGIPGTRPAGIFTAGLAQRLINIDGFIPGKNVVIVGSGDIGLIMARRLTLSFCNVLAVVEIQKYPSGLTRNIVQCLNDFNIPLYLSHTVSKIYGRDRVEKVDISPIIDGKPDLDKSFNIKCDTILLSVGLIPENELSKKMGVAINPQTNGAIVDSTMMTNIEGVFACGNVLHVHDLVDYVTEEARLTGSFVCKYLKNELPQNQIKVRTGANIRYIVPQKLNPQTDNKIYLRSLIVKNNAIIEAKLNGEVIKKINKNHIQPSEMISFNLTKNELEKYTKEKNAVEISIY